MWRVSGVGGVSGENKIRGSIGGSCSLLERVHEKGGGGRAEGRTSSSFCRYSPAVPSPRLVLWISGTVLSSSSFSNDHAVYSRKHLPGEVRPARPARWLADA